MINLPTIPDPWSDQYRIFENQNWVGWVKNEYCGQGKESKLNNLESLFDQENIVIWHKNKRNKLAEVRWPYSGVDSDQTVVLKSYQASTAFNALRLRFGLPRATRHWNNAWLLSRNKINTPQPVLLAFPKQELNSQGLIAVETIHDCLRPRELLNSRPDQNGMIEIGDDKIALKILVEACGKYIREIHDRGLVHRDMSGANILIPNSWDGNSVNLSSRFVILDINRVRQIPEDKLDINFRIQDLERLNIPLPHLLDFYLAYCGQDKSLVDHWNTFLQYRGSYRKIRQTKNPIKRGALKLFFYWPRTG